MLRYIKYTTASRLVKLGSMKGTYESRERAIMYTYCVLNSSLSCSRSGSSLLSYSSYATPKIFFSLEPDGKGHH